MAKLVALAAIAAGLYASAALPVEAGTTFEVTDQSVIDKMLADQVAQLAPDTGATDGSTDGSAGTTTATTTTTTDAPKTSRVTKKKVRLLVDSDYGKVNSVVDMDSTAIRSAENAGLVDSSKEAVAYAQTLDQNQPLV